MGSTEAQGAAPEKERRERRRVGRRRRERGDETTRRPRVRDASRREAIETVYDQCGRARLTLSGVRYCAHLFGQELCAGRRIGHGESRVSLSRRQPHWMGMPERDRDETVAAAPAAATSLVIRRTSDQILQNRCRCLWGARRRLCPCRTPASRRMAL